MKIEALQPPRRFWFGPGPTMVESAVYQALAKPRAGHLDRYFIDVLDQAREMLRSVFGTRNPPRWAISGTGSPEMKTAGGFGPLAGKIFRIGLIGPLANEECVPMFLHQFARALKA